MNARFMPRGLADAVPSETPPIDLRSDTVTKPTPKMRQAMAEAEVGVFARSHEVGFHAELVLQFLVLRRLNNNVAKHPSVAKEVV